MVVVVKLIDTIRDSSRIEIRNQKLFLSLWKKIEKKIREKI